MRASMALVFALLVSGCVKQKDAEPRGRIVVRTAVAQRLVMVRNCAVDPFTGNVVRRYPEFTSWAMSRPLPDSGWYRMWGRGEIFDGKYASFCVNPRTNQVNAEPTSQLQLRFDVADRLLVRLNDNGSERWRFVQGGQKIRPANGPEIERNFRAWHYLKHGDLVFAGYEHALIAIDDASGKERWRISMQCNQLCAAEGFLLASFLSRARETWTEEVRGVDYRTGHTKFSLPRGDYKRSPRKFFQSQSIYIGTTKEDSIVLDADGSLLLEVQDEVTSTMWLGDRFVLATCESVSCWDKSGGQIWSAAFSPSFASTIELWPCGEHDVFVCNWCPISAQSVEVSRISGGKGWRHWTIKSATRREINHSKYFHDVYVELFDGYAVLVDQQDGCDYIEILSGSTGSSLKYLDITDVVRGPR